MLEVTSDTQSMEPNSSYEAKRPLVNGPSLSFVDALADIDRYIKYIDILEHLSLEAAN